ncbi:uncharacterized protein JCM10292_006485 [Rhodotorula paludigena]|uniref:uncharacterized protein n=1 Tax=Rhodotorula paludigena TaxID=86838 RepID=UPI00317E38EE
MATPPPYLLPAFDPQKAKVAELRGILLENDVPFSVGTAKKPELVSLFERHVRPRAASLLADFRSVRPSDHGVLDGESQGSSLRELDTEPEDGPFSGDDADELAAPARGAATKKKGGKVVRSRARKSAAGAGRGRRGAESDEEDALEVEPPKPAKKRGGRKSLRHAVRDAEDEDEAMQVDAEEVEYEAPMDYEAPLRGDEEDDVDSPPPAAVRTASVSPKKRKEPATPRLSDLVKKADSPSDGNFSDFNPFQSGGEETPGREVKRRKSSLGPSRLRGEGESLHKASPRKSMPALTSQQQSSRDSASSSAGAWATPDRAPATRGPRARSSLGGAALGGTPQSTSSSGDLAPALGIPPYSAPGSQSRAPRVSFGGAVQGSAAGTPTVGVQYMVPVNKVKTTPPQMAALLREREAASAPALASKGRSSTGGGRVAGPSPQTRRKSSSPVEELAPAPAAAVTQGRNALKPRRQQQGTIMLKRASDKTRSVLPGLGALVSALPYALALVAFVYLAWAREEKLAAGFCDTSSSTNARLASRGTSLAVPSLPALSPRVLSALDAAHLRPSCTPCPSHGHCTDGVFAGCTRDYVPRRASAALSLAGLVPLAPRCVPDTHKLMLVAQQAATASHLLRRRRGEVVCSRGLERQRRKDRAGGREDAFVFGVEAERVLEVLRAENDDGKAHYDEDVLEEVSRLALRDLEAHGEVVVWQNGYEYWYASTTAEMPFSCQARLYFLAALKRHKTFLGSLLALLGSVLYVRRWFRKRAHESTLVAQLVQVALRQLQQQERSHYADPVHIPFPHVAPSHLRDLVLQSEHSPARRARLWQKVARVVEGNANVRVGDVEVNGEELRGWTWTGPHSAAAAAVVGQGDEGERVERPEMSEGERRAFVPSSPAGAAFGR